MAMTATTTARLQLSTDRIKRRWVLSYCWKQKRMIRHVGFSILLIVFAVRNFQAIPSTEIESTNNEIQNTIDGIPAPSRTSVNDNKLINNHQKSSNNYNIGIFVAANERGHELYDSNLQSILCYGQRHGYDVIIVKDLNSTVLQTSQKRTLNLLSNIDEKDDTNNLQQQSSSYYRCQYITGYSFQRQCVVLHVLPYYDFLVVLDADIGVANANITIESIIQRASQTTSPPIKNSTYYT